MQKVATSLQLWIMMSTLLVGGVSEGSAQEGSRIVFVSDRDGNREIYAMQADGSDPTNLSNHPGRDQAPALSPDRSHIAFFSDRSGIWSLWIMAADGGQPRRVAALPHADFGLSWGTDGRIAWTYQNPQDQTHDLAVIDPETGDWRLLTETTGIEEITPGWAPHGASLVFLRDEGKGTHLFELMLEAGTTRQITQRGLPGATFPRWSPDGRSVLVRSRLEDNFDVYRVAMKTGEVERLTTDPGSDWGASWSPDGSRIVFNSDRDGDPEIFSMAADGTDLKQLTRNQARDWLPVW